MGARKGGGDRRKNLTVKLAPRARLRLEERAHVGGFSSLGSCVEHMILDDARSALELFPLFREGLSLDEIVLRSHLSPGTVKAAFREYTEGLDAGLAAPLPRVERARQRRHDQNSRLKLLDLEDRSTGRVQRVAAAAMRAATMERIASERAYTERQRAFYAYLRNGPPIDASGIGRLSSEPPTATRHDEPPSSPEETPAPVMDEEVPPT